MPLLNRRSFLGYSAGGLAAYSLGSSLLGQDKSAANQRGSVPQPPHDSLFLTWQKDPTTTVTIQWIGPETSDDTSIQFAPVGNKVLQVATTVTKPYPGTQLQVFRCELTALTPGSDYSFQIGTNAANYRFRTMPAKATDTITFVTGGDAGVDEHAVNSNKIAAKQDPYFVLIAGDLAYDNGRAPDTFLKFLQNYAKHMVDSKGGLIPMIAAIGNHEVDGGFNRQRKDGPAYLSVFDGFYSEKTYGVFDVGDYLSLVLLDTGHIAPITGEQTEWLAKILAERQERPHLIVANHVPAYPSYRSPDASLTTPGTGAAQRKFWCPLFEKFNVDLVLEHHDHTFKRTHPLIDGHPDKNGVLYLGDGSWGKLRAPKTPEQRPYLAKVSEAYHVTTHRLEGDERFHVALEESGKVADVTMTKSKRPARRG